MNISFQVTKKREEAGMAGDTLTGYMWYRIELQDVYPPRETLTVLVGKEEFDAVSIGDNYGLVKSE